MYTKELVLEVKRIITNYKPHAWPHLKHDGLSKPLIQELFNSTSFLDVNPPVKLTARFFCVLNNIQETPTCKLCGKPTAFTHFKRGFRVHCSTKCGKSDPDVVNGYKQTCLKKYGVDNHNKVKEIRDRGTKTCIEKYGVKNVSLLDEIKNKKAKTAHEHYGVDNVFQSKDIRKKAKHTLKEKYGDEYYSNREKFKQTCLEKYGVDNPTKLKEFSEKALKTTLKRKKYLGFNPNIGKNEKKLLDMQEKIDNCTIIRDFKYDQYYPDGYCKETNTIYEVYEKYHKQPKQQIKDFMRQKYIEDKLS